MAAAKRKVPLADVDRVWLWLNGRGDVQVATEVPRRDSAEFVRADYTWAKIQKRMQTDEGVDVEVLVKRQAKRIKDLERQNASAKESHKQDSDRVAQLCAKVEQLQGQLNALQGRETHDGAPEKVQDGLIEPPPAEPLCEESPP